MEDFWHLFRYDIPGGIIFDPAKKVKKIVPSGLKCVPGSYFENFDFGHFTGSAHASM